MRVFKMFEPKTSIQYKFELKCTKNFLSNLTPRLNDILEVKASEETSINKCKINNPISSIHPK